jgi:hypothetical protein
MRLWQKSNTSGVLAACSVLICRLSYDTLAIAPSPGITVLLTDDPSIPFSWAGGIELNEERNFNAMRISIRRVYDVHRQSGASYDPLTHTRPWKPAISPG